MKPELLYFSISIVVAAGVAAIATIPDVRDWLSRRRAERRNEPERPSCEVWSAEDRGLHMDTVERTDRGLTIRVSTRSVAERFHAWSAYGDVVPYPDKKQWDCWDWQERRCVRCGKVERVNVRNEPRP